MNIAMFPVPKMQSVFGGNKLWSTKNCRLKRNHTKAMMTKKIDLFFCFKGYVYEVKI